ncbi:RAB11-binding protein RELCH homolog [Oppia nitens]|uniref:RAB11-binding protein RELCH homolog n=1 Tax=Oppia nitens TaxID=1686743 RepID=UPI0023DA6EC7|nr:RAB11-binding protein RELCH homolog [Oppia nitens]
MMTEVDPNSILSVDIVSFDKIAHKLIKEGFLLTALEFHAELLENGKELPRLRDFFSNPTNFEKQSDEELTFDVLHCPLPRTSSEQTFDSLDFTRNSDDGERQMDERIAVLEFELRKARETIKSLRASLTVSSSAKQSDSSQSVTHSSPETTKSVTPFMFNSCPVTYMIDSTDSSAGKPYEIRVLNYLVNEYLMKHNYKLTSITFCDENEEQDFESWDDVGLNVTKPPDILQLFRNYWSQSSINSSELTTNE